jgi:DNA-binding response OmpR family regulator
MGTIEEIPQKQFWDILLIDDESELLLCLGELLRTEGFEVITATDAGRAMVQLDENTIGVVVLDRNLAGEDGLRLMSYLKVNHPSVPMILYTGMPHEDEHVQTMLALGAACYVSKAQHPNELIAAIRQIMAGK